MTPPELFQLVKTLTETRSNAVLQALGDHLPMRPAAAIALLSPFFGGHDVAIRLVAQGLDNECLELWRGDEKLDEVPEEPSDLDQLRMGPAFVPTLEAFGAAVQVQHKNAGDDEDALDRVIAEAIRLANMN